MVPHPLQWMQFMKNQESGIIRIRSTIRSNITPTLFNIFVKVFQKKYCTKQHFLRIYTEELFGQNQRKLIKVIFEFKLIMIFISGLHVQIRGYSSKDSWLLKKWISYNKCSRIFHLIWNEKLPVIWKGLIIYCK